MDTQDVRAKQLAQLTEKYGPLPECLPDWTQPDLGRYLVILHATGDGDTWWFAVCPTLQDVVAHWRLELDPYDWLLRAIVDLDTGAEVPFFLGLSFAPIVSVYDPAEV